MATTQQPRCTSDAGLEPVLVEDAAAISGAGPPAMTEASW